jgi:TonB family protein
VPQAAISAALHLLILLLLLLPSRRPEDRSPPPSNEVALVFESAHPEVAASAKPAAAAPSPPAAPTPAPQPAKAPAAPQPAPPPPPAPPPAPLPETVRLAPAAPEPPSQLAALAEPLLPPQLPEPLPPERPLPSERPSPPERPSPSEPARAAPSPAPRPEQPHPAAPRLAAPRPHETAPSFAAASGRFPAPLMRNWFIPSAAATHPSGFSRAAASSERPAATRGADLANPYDVKGAEQLGASWFNAFMEWVEEHKHYPEQAIANNEDGDSRVEFTVGRDGRVREVELIERSGSVWLDMGLTGMFRGAKLPAFPYDATQPEVTISFTMHYILTR